MKNTKISWLVSVLICTYNAEKTIKETIQSCIIQSYKKIEILIHDDQSKDNTINIIKNIHDKRIKIIPSWKKLWAYWWLNFLLEKSQGEFIAIQDHDDLRHHEKLKQQIAFLNSNDWKSYIWCGTKTLMRYESDQKGFEYFLWESSYYTIHPSLVFRNQSQRYPNNSIYMNDALFQKKILCKWEKRIHNINEILTFHRIKDGASNFSYKRFKYSKATFISIYQLHSLWYWICIILWETIRKIVYPILHLIWKSNWIDILERKPFKILGKEIYHYPKKKIKDMWFIIS